MALSKSKEDALLMKRFQGGDEAAFRILYDRYASNLLYYLYRMLGGDESTASDILQDVFMRVAEKRHNFNQELKFSTWLFSIASNLCKNEYRHRAVRRIMENAGNPDIFMIETDDIDVSIDMRRFENALQLKLMEMDWELRSTFVLRYQENYPIREIARILECPEGTVKSRLFYITKKLANQLIEYQPEA